MKSLKKIFRLNSILLIVFFFILSSCKKSCEECTQMVSEHYFPNRDGYPKTTSSKYNSCGPANSWIGEQVIIDRETHHDTVYTKILSTDCQ
jgi:hypothetical protein